MAVVLVADDDPDILDLLALVLERSGHEVHVAHDGHEAWDAIEARTFDVVVLDVMMPRVSGLQVLGRCRAEPRTSAVPVVLLTACSQRSDIEGGLTAVADRYLTKPFSLREVVGVVDDLATRRTA